MKIENYIPEHSAPVHTISERSTVEKGARNANHRLGGTFDTAGASARVNRTNRRRTRQKCRDIKRGVDYDGVVFGPEKGKHIFTRLDIV
jgi:hypothetical protein